MTASPTARPILKWAGGKSQLLSHILPLFPATYTRYWEPFFGGGAVFFRFLPPKATLVDVNEDLIITYKAIRTDVQAVIDALKTHRADKDYYYKIRALDKNDLNPAEAAARILFLNRCCFNGLYRVNKKGQFNVPFGQNKNPTICNEKVLRAAAKALKGAKLMHATVFEIEHKIAPGDLVYLDPPYDPLTPTASFTSYTSTPFGENEQVQLAAMFGRLIERGVHAVLSNSDTPLIRDLYRGYRIRKVLARRSINSNAEKRGPVHEVLITQ